VPFLCARRTAKPLFTISHLLACISQPPSLRRAGPSRLPFSNWLWPRYMPSPPHSTDNLI
jgi:hypothetical protein